MRFSYINEGVFPMFPVFAGVGELGVFGWVLVIIKGVSSIFLGTLGTVREFPLLKPFWRPEAFPKGWEQAGNAWEHLSERHIVIFVFLLA